MKKFIILAIIFGLASNSGLAMKREREESGQAPIGEGETKEPRVEQISDEEAASKQSRIKQNAQVFQLLEQQLRSEANPLSREMVLLNISNDEIVRGIEFINSNNLQNQYPASLEAFNNRIFVQCNDGVIRHFNKLILNNMETVKNLLEGATEPITLADPLPIPNMPMKEFITLYQIVATSIAQVRAKGFAQLSTNAKIQNLHVPLQHILHRNNFAAADLLVAAFCLSLPDFALDALARETAVEIGKYPKAFPTLSHVEIVPEAALPEIEPGMLYTEFLPDNVKTLSKDILASIMRQFFLINPNETQPRLVSKCYHKDDVFCLTTLQFDLPMRPFSIAELLQHKKITIKNNILDLRRMNINDATGFENIPGLNQITELWLTNNQLQQLPANFLNNCPQLKRLGLGNNQLRELPADFLNSCLQLQELGLEINQLRELPASFLNNCPQLRKLGLFSNQLRGLPAGFLNNCPQLQRLGLFRNQLQQLPTNFLHSCPQLQQLMLQHNQLNLLPENFLNNCPKLQQLGLNHNLLQELPANFLNNCPQLQTFGLHNNQLQQLPANFLNNAAQLQTFGLLNNQLSSEAIKQIKETLLRQGKVVDGKKIILEPQEVGSKQEKTNE